MYTLQCTSAGEHWLDSIIISVFRLWNIRKNFPCVFNTVLKKSSPLFRGFDDVFNAPHSREVGILKEDVDKVPELELIADSEAGGPTILKTTDSKNFFVLCHLEYDANTLELEYKRDFEKGLNPHVPYHYYPDDDPTKEPVVTWRSAGQLLFSNWLNYYVYQTTPYDIGNK